MPPITYPNQRTVTVHKANLGNGFLGINNDVWMSACRDLGYPATTLYLYLASNKDNYQFALSPAAIQNALGMPRTTYRDQIRNLITKGYLVESGGNRFDFYETPRKTDIMNTSEDSMSVTAHSKEECAFAVDEDCFAVDVETGEIIEINNKYGYQDNKTINKERLDFKTPIVKSERVESRTWRIEDF